uniref:Uncharacterized protein n=1 Tax=Arundo donax TaxID=35708 RepID=A0A0A8Y969_ARUDO
MVHVGGGVPPFHFGWLRLNLTWLNERGMGELPPSTWPAVIRSKGRD